MSELTNLIEQHKRGDGYSGSDEEALGVMIAAHFEWDGLAIMRTFEEALTDANFHSEAAKVAAMREAEARA